MFTTARHYTMVWVRWIQAKSSQHTSRLTLILFSLVGLGLPPKKMAHTLTFLIYIQEVFCSNFSQGIVHPDSGLSWFSRFYQAKLQDKILNKVDRFLLYPFPFIIHCHPIIWFYTSILLVSDSVVKKSADCKQSQISQVDIFLNITVFLISLLRDACAIRISVLDWIS
jgi:hypothetical protein